MSLNSSLTIFWLSLSLISFLMFYTNQVFLTVPVRNAEGEERAPFFNKISCDRSFFKLPADKDVYSLFYLMSQAEKCTIFKF